MGEERKYRWIGTRPIRHDGVDKVTGRANFGADFALPGVRPMPLLPPVTIEILPCSPNSMLSFSFMGWLSVGKGAVLRLGSHRTRLSPHGTMKRRGDKESPLGLGLGHGRPPFFSFFRV